VIKANRLTLDAQFTFVARILSIIDHWQPNRWEQMARNTIIHRSRRPALDAAAVAAVPPTAVIGAVSGSGASGPGVLVDPVQAQERRDQPADGRQEGEGEVGLPLAASSVEAGAAPVEDVSIERTLWSAYSLTTRICE